MAGNRWWAVLSCLSCWLCCYLLKSWMFLGWSCFPLVVLPSMGAPKLGPSPPPLPLQFHWKKDLDCSSCSFLWKWRTCLLKSSVIYPICALKLRFNRHVYVFVNLHPDRGALASGWEERECISFQLGGLGVPVASCSCLWDIRMAL